MGLHSTKNSLFRPEEISQPKTNTQLQRPIKTHMYTDTQTQIIRKKNSDTHRHKQTRKQTLSISFSQIHTEKYTQAHQCTKADSLLRVTRKQSSGHLITRYGKSGMVRKNKNFHKRSENCCKLA